MKKTGHDYRIEASADLAPDEGEAVDGDVETRSAVVDEAAHGKRLDKVLAAAAHEFSRTHLQRLIAGGHVRIDGHPAAVPSRKLRLGQRLEIELVPTAQSLAFRAEPIALNVVHEDEHVLVLDKPAGLVVHPAAGNWSGTLLNGLLAHHPGAAALPRAGIVHRLDKDTSGLMVVAKTLPAMAALVDAIAAREVQREYLALAHGELRVASMVIDAPIGRDPRSRIRMGVVAGGKPSRTLVQRIAAADGVSALRCRLDTGRTHQIRVHLASKGHPLVADALYGGWPVLGMKRQALHAAALRFAHPVHRDSLAFECAPPRDFAAAWDAVTG